MLGASFCVFAFFDLFSQVEAENKNLQRVAISIPSIATLGLTWMAFGDGIADSFIFFSFVCLTLTALFLEGQQKHKISFLLFYAPVAAYCYVLPRSLSGLIFCIVMGFLGLLFSIKIYEEVKTTPST